MCNMKASSFRSNTLTFHNPSEHLIYTPHLPPPLQMETGGGTVKLLPAAKVSLGTKATCDQPTTRLGTVTNDDELKSKSKGGVKALHQRVATARFSCSSHTSHTSALTLYTVGVSSAAENCLSACSCCATASLQKGADGEDMCLSAQLPASY